MKTWHTYLKVENAELFTLVSIPNEQGKFPTFIMRSPYMDKYENVEENEILAEFKKEQEIWAEKGWAVVLQHCRGRGKSSGEFIPYIHERADGLALQQWIRKQPFYNGELYLVGGSYTTTVHFLTAPFATDIKGAIFGIQDCNRYNLNYRNGQYKMGLVGGWYAEQYKKKTKPERNYTVDTFKTLPLIDFPKIVFDESVEDFENSLLSPDGTDDFWKTPERNAIKNANIPILLQTGFYDIYTGGIFDMWNEMDEQTRSKSALLVHPYDHDGNSANQPIQFENDTLTGSYKDLYINWFESIRGKEKSILEKGKVTYYKLFGAKWETDEFAHPKKQMTFTLGTGEITYRYNPYNPATFQGGLSTNFGGTAWQDKPNSRYDILSFYTPEFTKDIFVKGKMKAKLCVKSTCEDTCFYVRISLAKAEGDYGLRDDINQISNFCADYKAGEELEMDFTFDEHAFVIHKGERLRVDISSSAFPWYVPHTNNKGLYSIQTVAKVADNTVVLDKSSFTIPYKE